MTSLVTDNAANMKCAWGKVREKFPNIHTYGCLAHTLNLLFSDIKRNNTASTTMKYATALVKNFKSSQRLTALLTEEQTNNEPSLKLAVKTRYI